VCVSYVCGAECVQNYDAVAESKEFVEIVELKATYRWHEKKEGGSLTKFMKVIFAIVFTLLSIHIESSLQIPGS
jgi:hypothetical protein